MSINTSGTLTINVEESGKYLKLVEENRKIKPCDRPVGLGNTRISTDYAQKSPRTFAAFSPFPHHCDMDLVVLQVHCGLALARDQRNHAHSLRRRLSRLHAWAPSPHTPAPAKQCLAHHPTRPGSHSAHHHRDSSGGSLEAQQAECHAP